SNIVGRSMDKGLRSIFNVLREGGYKNLYSGKCHFVPVPYGDIRKGLTREYTHFRDYYMGLGIDELYLEDGTGVMYYDDYAREVDAMGLLEAFGRPCGPYADVCVPDFPGPDRMHEDHRVADRAVGMIEGSEGAGPTFLWASFNGPHYPINAPQSYRDKVDISKAPPRRVREGEWDDLSKAHRHSYHGPEGGEAHHCWTEGSNYAKDRAQKNYDDAYWDNWRTGYVAKAALVDEGIGRILEAADRVWGDDYACVFTADHGDMAGNHSLWAKNNCMYEDVIRIPMMVYDGGRRVGVDGARRASAVDVFPTCLDLLGMPGVECEGGSLLAPDRGDGTVICEMEGILTVISGDHKMTVYDFAGIGKEYTEIYDLTADPHEFTNLAHLPDEGPGVRRVREAFADVCERHALGGTVFYKQGMRPYWLD
ncbi:MAG: sulfatase-like hydrolase/transferase, partial [Oscillospiraceae bacterium]|nr:sulfatase-like hydrolase/transferase [Oscillospiraceae bacterium]